MEDVLIAIHTQELMLRENFVSHITVTTDKNLDQVVHVTIVHLMKELKELVSLVDQTDVMSDKESAEMEPVCIAHYTKLSAEIEKHVPSQLVNQWLNIFQKMVFANHVLSTKWLDLMEPPVSLIQLRSFQIHK